MQITGPLALMALGLVMAGPGLAQTSGTTETPPAEAAPEAEAAAADAVPPPTETEPGADVTAEGNHILPNGMDITADYMENGRWYNAEGIPTFKIDDDVVDYAVFSGYRRYHAECHVCHGPDGEGSTYAPALKDSVLKMDYYQFQEIVASGKKEVNAAANQVMPAFATNKNVWCYVDDIYVYLLVRGTDSVARGRPAKKADKSPEFTAQEDACMNG
ncbi:c-type cytochrome, methanol metabolism-related [uncultured Paracoccus sp.]|uniref:c-type cytochrome, methanol metabolism-related n=1 Tax=uncultured Paracoccus sp. TaxID=189685 RepID=UPI00260D2A0F|nr:c-type cytochrome, methanol metabolism-related [uncultured Paracoccus sp.]